MRSGVLALAGLMGLAVVVPPASASAAAPDSNTRLAGWSASTITLEAGERFTQKVVVAPQGKRRYFQVKWRRDSGGWKTEQRGRATRSGRVRVKYKPPAPGRYAVKIKVKRSDSARGVTTKARRVVVAAPAPEPAPTPVPTFIPTPAPTLTPALPPGTPFTAYAVGDVGFCGGEVAKVSALVPDEAMLLLAGDIAYPDGTATDFANCYLPYFGRLLNTTVPSPGNHEYRDPALAYFDVFGPRVGTRALPWYVVKQGDWSFYQLNSNCDAIGGCRVGSREYQWLAAQLSIDTNRCIAVTWHHPRWSVSLHGPYKEVEDIYRLLESYGADLLLAGHEHSYQRFGRLGANGRPAPRGIREIVVGTGGAPLAPITLSSTPLPEVWETHTHGVLRLDFRSNGYDWEFLATDGGAVDSGSDTCS